jgi:hypothetical protein
MAFPRLPFHRPVHCVDCGFLTRHVYKSGATLGVTDPAAEPPTLSPGERAAIREGNYQWAESLICHLGVADFTERRQPSNGDWYSEFEFPQFMMNNAAKPRDCGYFYRFQPGRTPREHVKSQDTAKETGRARRWDVLKGLLARLIGGLVVVGGLAVLAAKAYFETPPLP